MSIRDGSVQRLHILGAVLVVASAGLAGAWLGAPHHDPPPVAVSRPDPPAGPEAGPTEDTITVHVAGAVDTPGLVTVEAGQRVAHAISAAGGALGSADLSRLNLAAVVHDGDQVTVPGYGEPLGSGTQSGGSDDGKVYVNTASAVDLEALPGVGPILAQRIFAYREEHGRFATIEDLLDVPGIGEGKLATLREAAVVR